jgi:anti-sigma factor RsiW
MADPEEPACQEFVELVSDYLEGALDRRTRRRVEAHLAGCDGCEAYLEQIRATVATAGSLREQRLAPETRAALLALFRGWAGAA